MDVRPGKLVFCLVAGETAPGLDVPTAFLGSAGWMSKLAPSAAVGSRDTGNPFGAAAAACIGMANAFRSVFAEDLREAPLDPAIVFDALHHRLDDRFGSVAPAAVEHIGETHLVGLGAIGRATAWSMSRAPGPCGVLHDECGATKPERSKRGRLRSCISGIVYFEHDQADVVLQDMAHCYRTACFSMLYGLAIARWLIRCSPKD